MSIIAFTQFNLFGDVLDVCAEDQNKVIVLAVASLSKSPNTEPEVFGVISSAQQSEDVAAIEEALVARRAETGDEKAPLAGVHLTVRFALQSANNAENKRNQVQLICVGKSEPKVIETEVTKAPVEIKATSTEDELTFQKLLLTLLINQNHNSNEL